MIEMKELLKGAVLNKQPKVVQDNLAILLAKVNIVRSKYGKPMTVTSGLRTMEDHLRIYREKGIIDPKKIPMRSNHLFGAAVDIADPKGELKKWVLENKDLMEELNLFMEDFDSTPGWVHFQIVPFGSYKAGGTRFFRP